MPGALAPYRVLDLTDERGLTCGLLLADLGAEVIAVEPPGGSLARRLGPRAHGSDDPESSLWWWAYARGRRSVVADLETEAGRERLRSLVRDADVLVESFPPGHLAAHGLGYEDLAAVNPRLVVVSITPFGQTGPKARWAASDLTVMASSGQLLFTGDTDRPPVRTSVPQAFLHAGVEGAVGALVALSARERNGVGQHVDVAAQTSIMITTQAQILSHGWGELPAQRMAGGAKLGPVTMRFVYECKDGYVCATFLFGNLIGPFTARLVKRMAEEGFADEKMVNRDWIGFGAALMSGAEPMSELVRCMDMFEQFTRAHTKAELFAEAQRLGLLMVPVTTTADVVASEQLVARGFWREETAPDGCSYTFPGPLAAVSTPPTGPLLPAPRVGEHDRLLPERRPLPPARASSSPTLPFAGLKVLDFTWVVVGPSAVRYLADYGATVVRVESSTRIDAARTFGPFKDSLAGPERSGQYANWNAGKLGITLNPGTPEGREIALELARWADIVFENYSPRAMRAWGLDYEALRQVNPNIIMVSASLNGQTGPQAMLGGFGTMAAALSGFYELTGWPDRPPAGPFLAYTDYVAPRMIAAAAMAAIDHRRRTGEGQYLDLSQSECTLPFIAPAILDYTVNGHLQSRDGNRSPQHSPHGVFPCRGEDRWVAVAVETAEEWAAFCHATSHDDCLADPRFATLADRKANEDALEALVSAWTAARTVDEVEDCLQAARVPVHRCTGSADAFTDPQVLHRGHFITVDHPELGPVPIEASRVRLSTTPARHPSAAPTFGQHNHYVLAEILGLSEKRIASLAAAGVLE
ncbi:MAG: CoA transferase [Dehalococcoidia bacterium]|nr:CoA transferase [Dehalococcoidia bacterium]